MKKLLILLSILLTISASFANRIDADEASLDYLNQAIHSKYHYFVKAITIDDSVISEIKNLNKTNPFALKYFDTKTFSLACKERNQSFLISYEKDYFQPAYNEYKRLGGTMDFDDWKDSIALSERSEFYDFYRATEINLEDCTRLYERVK